MQSATNERNAVAERRQDAECLGLQWSVDPTTRFGRAVCEQGVFAPVTTRLLLAAVQPGMVVLDVGAHVGWFTMLLGKRVGQKGRVIAFEPVACYRRELQRHLAQNDLQARTTVMPFGLSDQDGERTAVLDDSTATLHWTGGSVPRGREVVAVRRLDDVVVELGLPRIDLVRLDLDGHELKALRGAQNVIMRDRPLLSISFAQQNLHQAGADVRAQLALLHQLHYEVVDESTGFPYASDAECLAVCGNFDRTAHALAVPVERLAGMSVKLHEDLASLQAEFGLTRKGHILESDIDVPENDCELHDRKRRDAEVLCAIAANADGNCLDLGTSHGRSAFKLATNVGDEHTVFTVNMLPEQAAAAGVHITHVLRANEIGSYCREHGLQNVVQIYADTATWQPDERVSDLAMAFVDACHDSDAVRRDSHLAFERLRPGGFLLWHDYSPVQRQRHDWIRTSMLGVAQFLADIGHRGPVHHLRGSWIGLIRKDAR